MEITLLAAPLDTLPISGDETKSTSLVPASRLALSARTFSRSDTSYPGDDFVWSASAGEDGSYTFYAAPPKNSGSNGASSQWKSYSSSSVSGSDWYTRNAVTQYALHAAMPTAVPGRLVNLYA